MTPRTLTPICATEATCKCCGASATLYGVVDFHKSALATLPVSGIPIYYYRCPACAFLFATVFDDFSKEDFARLIYNEDYWKLDPEYETVRPRNNANNIAMLFAESKPRRLLDYGGGRGRLAHYLRGVGFPDVDTYDPFVPGHDVAPSERYDCIVCFEVMEHTPQPAETLKEMNNLLTENGLILFSTLAQPPTIDQLGLNWWYVLPRNGHISLYSRNSLRSLVRPFGFHYGWLTEHMHVLVREVPEFARSFIKT